MFDSKNIRKYYKLVLQKIGNFLLSDKCKEGLVFLFFVLVSFAFWMLQTLDDTYQTEFKMPLRLKNVPKEVVLTTDFPDEVRVRVEDRGTVLLNYMLGRTFLPVSFDFNDYKDTGARVRIAASDLSKRIATQLNVSTKLISIRPDTLEFVYAQGKAKKIPVRMDGIMHPARQYYISHVKLAPDSVMAYAPKEILDTLRAAYSRTFELENVADTVYRRLELKQIKGVKFIPHYADLTVCTDMYSEKTVEVPVTGIGFPSGRVLRTFPSKVQVTFQVGLKHFKEIKPEDFAVGVKYEDARKAKGDKLPLVIKSIPDNVEHVRLSPPSVDYLIEQQGTGTE